MVNSFLKKYVFGCIRSSLQHTRSSLCHAGSFTVVHRLPNCNSWAQLLHSMWDLSFPTRDLIYIHCIAKQILNHWTTREVPVNFFFKCNSIVLQHITVPRLQDHIFMFYFLCFSILFLIFYNEICITFCPITKVFEVNNTKSTNF